MSETATKLVDQLLQLSEADRLMIAEPLWGSVSEEKQQELIDEATSDPEIQAMVESRLREVEEHPERLRTASRSSGKYENTRKGNVEIPARHQEANGP